MGTFFAAFNLPGPHLRNGQKNFDQHIYAKILAGKKLFGLPVLRIKPAAGLNASTPKAALASQIAAPVTPSGNTIAQGTVDKYFQIKVFGAGRGHSLDLVYGKLPGNNDAVDTQFVSRMFEGCLKAYIRQCR